MYYIFNYYVQNKFIEKGLKLYLKEMIEFMLKNKTITFLLMIILLFNLSACGKNTETLKKNRQINVYVGVKDKESLNIIKFLTDEYKKKNPKVKVNINNAIGEKVDENVSESSDIDIVIASRNDMLKLVRKGLLADMGNTYEQNKLTDKYYTSVKSYGRFNDRYYGIAVMPYTIEILCNKSAFDKLGLKIPNNIDEFNASLKTMNSTSMRVPVVLNEGMDINNTLFSIISSNTITMKKLENIYDSGPSAYKKLTEVQKSFDLLNDLVKNGSINKDTFEIGNESSLKKFDKGDIPVIIASSYYVNNLKSKNIKCFEYYSPNSKSQLKVPIMADAIMSVLISSKNTEETNEFIKFAFGKDAQKKLSDKGFVTGFKSSDISKDGIKKCVITHLENSTEDNIAFIYNVPESFKNNISSKVDSILSGKYTKNEWNEVVDESS